MNTQNRTFALLLAFTSALFASVAAADEAGNGIWAHFEAVNSGWSTLKLRGTVTQLYREQTEFESVVEVTAARDEAGLTTLRTVVVEPPTLQGFALLAKQQPEGNAQGWMFLPSKQTVVSMQQADLRLPFLGTEFAIEDLLLPNRERFEFDRVASPSAESNEIILTATPKQRTAEYVRLRIYLDASGKILNKIIYLDANGSPRRTLRIEDYTKPENGQRLPQILTMTNHITDYATTIHWAEVKTDVALPADQLAPENLGAEFFAAHPELADPE